MNRTLLLVPLLTVACNGKDPEDTNRPPRDTDRADTDLADTDDTDGGDTDPPPCEEVATSTFDLADETPLGFTGAEIAGLVGGDRVATGYWVPLEASAEVKVHAEEFGEVTYHDVEGPGADCRDHLSIPAVVRIESFTEGTTGANVLTPTQIRAFEATSASMVGRVPLADVTADETALGITASEWDEVFVHPFATWTAGETPPVSGKLDVSASRASDGASIRLTALRWPE